MNNTIATTLVAATVGLAGCHDNTSSDAPQFTFSQGTPTAVLYQKKVVDLTLCLTDPKSIKLTNDSLQSSGIISAPEATKVCMSDIANPVEVIAMQTKQGWFFILRNTGNPAIDGFYKVGRDMF